MGVNKCIIVGRLGSDPELKTVTGGQTVCKFSIAVSESWVGKDGQKQDRVEWINIIAWAKLAENCGKYLAKGRECYVEGKLQTRNWEDTDGKKRYATEVVASNVQFIGGQAQAETSNKPVDNFGPAPTFDDYENLPF